MKQIFFILLYISVLFGLSSCKAKKNIKDGEKEAVSEKYILKNMAKSRISKQFLSAQSKVHIETKDINISGVSTIRMIKDSLIWMNVKKFGFEAGRLLITKDSFFMINRLQKSYVAEGISDLAAMVKGIPQELQPLMNLKGIQDIILGNPVMIPVKSYEIIPVENTYELKGETVSGIKTNYSIQASSFLLDKMKFSDETQKIDLITTFGDFRTVGDIDFSHQRVIDFTQKETFFYKLFIDFYNVEFDVKKTIQFEIPERYTKTNL